VKRLSFSSTAPVLRNPQEDREIYNKRDIPIDNYRYLRDPFKQFTSFSFQEILSINREKKVSRFSIHRIRLLLSAMLMEKRLTLVFIQKETLYNEYRRLLLRKSF